MTDRNAATACSRAEDRARNALDAQPPASAAAAFVAFDLLPINGRDLGQSPPAERRASPEHVLRNVAPPPHVTPMTRDPAVAAEWLARFEGAGFDGLIAKPAAGTYEPGKRHAQDQTRAHGRLRRPYKKRGCAPPQECAPTKKLLD